MLQLTVFPPLLPNNEDLSVASDTGSDSCQYEKCYGRHYGGLGNRVRIVEIWNDTRWRW